MDTRTTEHLSRRMALFAPSRAVTDILALAERPDVVSLAGGLPDPSSFPLERIRESMDRVLRDEGREALNYGPNPGATKLRDWIAERTHAREGVPLSRENVLVTSGGLEALHLTSMALIDRGDVVLVEAPTYMMALHVFRTFEARIVPVPMDDEGLDPDALDAKLRELKRDGVSPRFLYTIPSFQNPSGRTLTEARRRRIVDLCDAAGFPIVEDHAYGELCYEGERPPTLKSLAPENVIFIHTFSKIFGPGVRLGWVAAEPTLIEGLGLCKLGTDQCANTLTQRLVYDYGHRGGIDAQVSSSLELYCRKRDLMESAMRRHFPSGVSWVHPRGGFFVWVRLAEGTDTEALLVEAIERFKTAFVAGRPFFVDDGGRNFLRLSFSYVPEGQIEEGVRRVAEAFSR